MWFRQSHRYLGRHLGFYQELESRLRKIAINGYFLCLTCKVTHKYALCTISSTSYFYCWKKLKKPIIFTQKLLEHLLRMTSYLVTIVTDHHLTCLEMRLRDKWKATENVRCWCFIVQEKYQKTSLGWQPFPPTCTSEGLFSKLTPWSFKRVSFQCILEIFKLSEM